VIVERAPRRQPITVSYFIPRRPTAANHIRRENFTPLTSSNEFQFQSMSSIFFSLLYGGCKKSDSTFEFCHHKICLDRLRLNFERRSVKSIIAGMQIGLYIQMKDVCSGFHLVISFVFSLRRWSGVIHRKKNSQNSKFIYDVISADDLILTRTLGGRKNIEMRISLYNLSISDSPFCIE
jgi:hypothetical protein